MLDRAPSTRLEEGAGLALALQGGGSHGAYTWGVLDALIEAGRFEFPALSGTSAGAVNAVALASGWMNGGAVGARETLAAVWRDIAASASAIFHVPAFSVPEMGDLSGSAGAPLAMALRFFGPSQLNPFDLNPLRRILDERIDFAALRAAAAPRLFVAATHVRTGRSRIFANDEIGPDAVLASGCLPQLNRAVEIEGEAYWDGGFSANPTLLPLAFDAPARDILLVMIDPLEVAEVPATSKAIRGRVGQIVFNAPLMREIETLGRMRAALADRPRLFGRPRGGSQGSGGIEDIRLHVIDSGGDLASYDADSKVYPSPSTFGDLFGIGRAHAGDWLAAHGGDVGHRGSLRLEGLAAA